MTEEAPPLVDGQWGDDKRARPCQQIVGDEGEGHPRMVDGETGRRQVGQAGVLEVADSLLGPAPAPLQRLQVGDVFIASPRSVMKTWKRVVVAVGEGQLGTRVGPSRTRPPSQTELLEGRALAR